MGPPEFDDVPKLLAIIAVILVAVGAAVGFALGRFL
jgi:hypothetical protein